jgi:hypothetical protein
MIDDPKRENQTAPELPTRRDFLGRVGVGACAIAAAGSGIVTLDY